MMGIKKKTKRRVFMKCHMNSFGLIGWWPKWIRSPIDSTTTVGWWTKWVWSPPLDSVITIKFSCHHWMESKKGGIWQTPFCLFQSPTRMGNQKKYGHHSIAIISQVESLEKGACHMFLKSFWRKFSQNTL